MIERKMLSAKTRCEQRILTEYPTYRQLNIIRQGSGYAKKDLNKMNSFIDAVRARCDKYEAEIKVSKDPESIKIDYDDIKP